MKKLLLLLTLSTIFTFTAACSNNNINTTSRDATNNKTKSSEKIDLTVSAAISLTDALEDIQKEYEKTHNVTLKFNLGSSGTLAQQIIQGAPVDIFISANQEWMDTLEEKSEIINDSRTDITGNNIVLITQKDHSTNFKKIEDIDSAKVGQIAIGYTDSVPAGKYTKQTLENMNKWNDLQDNFIMAKDVRQVLTYVESKNAEVGFVYGSDANTSDKIKVIDTADIKFHDPIIYPAAVTKQSKHEEAANAFITYLTSNKGQEKLEKYGFKKQ